MCLKHKEALGTTIVGTKSGNFLKAADLIAGSYRHKINAATTITRSKNIHQSDIDATYEFIDFLHFNVKFMTEFMQNSQHLQ